jgi:hypothetical protein
MNHSVGYGLAAAGTVFAAPALLFMYAWNILKTASIWLMGIAGCCYAAAGWGPLTTAVHWGKSGAQTVGAAVGIGGVIVLVVGLALTGHAVLAMHPKKGIKAGKGNPWAALFAPAVIISLGGFLAVMAQVGGLFHTALAGVGAFFGGGH